MNSVSKNIRLFSQNQSGSALLMVFMAMAAIAILTAVFFKQLETAPTFTNTLENKAKADQIISHAAALEAAFDIMVVDGVDPSNIEDTTPNEAGFDTSPHLQKLYHPQGGGAPYHDEFHGWQTILIHTNARITDVGTAADDIMAVGVIETEALCQQINKKLYGDETIPVVTDSVFDDVEDGTSTALLDDATSCSSGCDGKARGCLENTSGDTYLFYNVLYAQ